MFKYLLFIVLFFGELAHAQTVRTIGADYIDGNNSGFRNYAVNPYMDKNLAGITCTSFGTCSLTATERLQGAQSLSLTATSAAGTAKFRVKAFDRELYGRNCEFSIDVFTSASVVPHYDVYLENNGTQVGGTTTAMVEQANRVQRYTVQAPCGTASSGPYDLVIDSNATTGTNIKVDNFYAGLNRNVGDANIVTDWTDFPSVAAGTLITATTTNPTYGTVQTNKAQWRRVGANAEIVWHFRQTGAGTAGSGTLLFNIPAAIGTIDTSKITASTSTSAVSTFVAGAVGHFYYSNLDSSLGNGVVSAYSTTQLKVDFEGSDNGSAFECVWASSCGSFDQTTISFSIRATIPIAGWTSGNVVRMDQSNYDWVDGGAINIQATTTAPTKGTTSVDKFWYRRQGSNLIGRIQYKQTAAGSGANGTGDYLFRLPTGTGCTIDTTKVPANTTVYGYNATATTTYSVGTFSGFSGGTAHINGWISVYDTDDLRAHFILGDSTNGNTIGTFSAGLGSFTTSGLNFTGEFSIPCVGWTENQNAPLLVGGVTSGFSGLLRIETASINTSGTVTEKTGDWVNGNCTYSAGTLTCTWNNGIFSAEPTCIPIAKVTGGANSCRGGASGSATTYNGICFNTSTTGGVNTELDITCIGPR